MNKWFSFAIIKIDIFLKIKLRVNDKLLNNLYTDISSYFLAFLFKSLK